MERSFGNKYGKWIVAAVVVLALALWFYLSSGVENYADKYAGTDLTTGVAGIGRDNTYELYLQSHEGTPDATADIAVDMATVTTAEGVEVREEGVYTASGSEATWTVTVPEAGYYNVALTYLTVESRGVDLERELRINGELPFDGADTMAFSRLWADGGEVRTDNQGNEIRPTQVEIFDWQTAYCRDAMGYITEPYRFYFPAGESTLTLVASSEPFILSGITLKAPGQQQSYEDYIAAQPMNSQPEALKDFAITVQGEDSTRRSSPSLYARYDRSSPATEPCNVYATVLNYIGGDAWRDAGQWIEWEFEVPSDGWYNITIKGRQTYSRGSVSSRIFYLDGETPFDGLENVQFPYSTTWTMNTLSDSEGNAYRFYLTAGKHTIRLEATLGDMGSILSDMEESIYRLNQIYRKILVLTGVTPDQYRDYHLEQVYPEVIQAMDLESRLLYKLVDDSVAVTGQKSDRVAAAQTLAVQLETFVDDPAEITQAFTNFKDNITSLGTAMQNLRQVKLDIDQITITADGVSVAAQSESFISKAIHEIVSCVASYTVDYNALGNVYEGDEDSVLEVWILTGRDQSTVLKTMVDDTFTPNTGIPVNVMLVDPNALLNATVAGNGPDVVVSTDSWNPVNYALRGAAEDLTQFDDLEEVLSDFYPSAYQAFSFDNGENVGIYALPETQLCSILFYRSDILEEYGLEVPETWDDLIAMLPTIQGANMSLGIPYPDIVAPNLSSLYSMLYQRGGALYNEDATVTTINSEAGVQAFEMYTSLYNDYGLPTIFDFVSRFRSGEMPMGIFDYTTFNTLTVSAPEIRGLWDIAIMPGTERVNEDGTTYVDHSGHSQGSCCMMIATEDEYIKECAWEFMKWWVSTESQVRFGREIEAILGSSARYATANIEAIEQLAWSEDQLKVIREQMQWAVGFREVAGGYYTTRHLTNAVRKVTNDKTDPRETLLDYARTINEEIVKKRSEFGLPLE
ncbi:MAG: extracellular solute-binding protein [Clostridia bacterium]|nr:extracellular solute-binding protein [Clostridia bacterium]